jgi:hypothetical protein
MISLSYPILILYLLSLSLSYPSSILISSLISFLSLLSLILYPYPYLFFYLFLILSSLISYYLSLILYLLSLISLISLISLSLISYIFLISYLLSLILHPYPYLILSLSFHSVFTASLLAPQLLLRITFNQPKQSP